MRWTSFDSPADSRPRLGVVKDGYVFESPDHTDLLSLLGDAGEKLRKAGQDALANPAARWELAELVPKAPIPVPPSIRDFMAFEDHLKPILAARGATIDPAWYEIPAFYFTNPAAVLGPTEDVAAAPGAVELDFELEVAAVIGRQGSNLHPDEASSYIAGYILMSDWSARDLQRLERGVGLGPVKGKDWGTSFGPYFVTADELPIGVGRPGPDLPMIASINGRQVSDGQLTDLYWSYGQMISYASRGTQLRPGDVIGSGTVGTGCIADLAARYTPEEYPWLVPGDHMHLEAGILGSIDCRIVSSPAPVPLK